MNSTILNWLLFLCYHFSAKFDVDVAHIPGNLHQIPARAQTVPGVMESTEQWWHKKVAIKQWKKMLAGIGEIFQLYQLVREFKIPFGGEWLVCMEQA